MSHRERYRPASFRGVPFHVDEHEFTTGRRGEDHVYPGRDEPYGEDAGRRSERFTVTAFVIGPTYDLERNALIDAIRQPGPGTLIHPYLGTQRVIARISRMRESTRRGGMAVFQIEFSEAGRNVAPVSASNTARQARESAAAAADRTVESFPDRFSTDAPSWVVDAASRAVALVADRLDVALQPLTSLTGGLDVFRRDVEDLRASATDLVQTPILLAEKVRGIVQQYRRLPVRTRESFESLLDLARRATETLTPVPSTTELRRLQIRNEEAISGDLRRQALFQAAEVATALSFESRDDLVEARSELEVLFDEEIRTAGDEFDDAAVTSLEDVFTAVVRNLRDRDDGTLARVRTIQLGATEPSLVVAHRVHQDASRAGEIEARNRVVHPLFVPGGVDLQVLSG